MSVAHSFLFDTESGEIKCESNTCGYSNGSYWARGTAWATYGFAMAARYLNDDEYLKTAVKLAEKYIDSLGNGNFVPIWDLRLPKETPAKGLSTQFESNWDESDANNTKYNVDTSACAIMACALIELRAMIKSEKLSKFIEGSINALCSDEYINKDASTPGLLSHQNGCMTYTTYGDFFLMQALQTYLYNTKTCW